MHFIHTRREIMRKVSLLIALVLGIVGGVFYSLKTNSNVVVSEGKLEKGYSSLEEMESDTPLIVIGKKINGESIIERDEEGTPLYYFTLSDFEVKSVIKNETGQVIDKNQHIKILETTAYEEKHKQVLSVSGYIPMEDNKQYLLYLNPNDSEDGPAVGSFNIQSVVFGKFAFEKDKQVKEKLEEKETKHYEKDILKIHKEMANEVEKKYKHIIK
jgi:hypothetical protein